MPAIRPCRLPPDALLNRYVAGGAYVDCYVAEVGRPVSCAEYVEAFYTTTVFKLERSILRTFLSRPSTDAEARQLARGERDAFAAWTVEGRTPDQLLMADVAGRTRSWLMVAPSGTGITLLYFGSAVIPVRDRRTDRASLGPVFGALLGFHKLYSRVLLLSVRSRLRRNQDMPTTFRRQWLLLNTAALLTGYVLYTPIAHGITGSHATRGLTTPQLMAHSVALAVVGLLVAAAQRRALTEYVTVSWTRVVVAAIAFVLAFWIGYFQPWIEGPDTDMLLGFLVLGSAAWLGTVRVRGHGVAAAIAVLGFPIAGFVGELILFVAFTVLGVTPSLQTSELQHSLFWITVGGTAGILGGWLGGTALERMLPGQAPPSERRDPALAPDSGRK